jgi:hypothetical protein
VRSLRCIGSAFPPSRCQFRRAPERHAAEQFPNVEYLLEFLRRVRERTEAAFGPIQYVEQPTARDLKADRTNTMHAAAKLRPVVID